jgi:alanyl-tRNA synthetase
VRNTTRVTFVCGHRAIARARRDFELLDAAGRKLSAAAEDLPTLIEGQTAQLKDFESRLRRSDSALATYRARERYDAAAVSGGRRLSVERMTNGSPNDWRAFALAYSALPGGVFVAASDEPAAILLAAAADAGVDAGKRLKALVEAQGGRGGGSPVMAQGALPSADALARVLTQLLDELRA